MTTETVMQLLHRAIAHQTHGQLAQAAAIYSTIISADPTQPDALHLLGVALTQSGKAEHGSELIRKSLAINPKQPVAWANLGNAQSALQRLPEALTCYDRAIELWPDYALAHNGRGNALAALGRFQEALQSFDRAVALSPEFPQALGNRGLTLLNLQRPDEALAAFDRALSLQPEDVNWLTGRAVANCRLKRFAESLVDAEGALRLCPTQADARQVRCAALFGLGRFAETLMAADYPVSSATDSAELHFFCAGALRKLGRPAEAMRAFERALQLRADFPEALFELGALAIVQQQFERASTAFARLLEIAPQRNFALGAGLHSRLCVCDWRDYERTVEAILAGIDSGRRPDLPFSFLAICDDAARQLRCAQLFAQLQRRVREPSGSFRATSRERIRIAYISADLLDHPIAFLLAGLFESHARQRFEVIAISLRSAESTTAKRLRAAFDRFIDVTGQSDEEIARLIRQLEVDIAIDLMGYTAETRYGILERRPAPIQVNYLGYPGTMGVEHVDYILADRYVIPPEAARFYSEKVVYLPECFQANTGREPAGKITRAEAGLPDAGFIWCAFHASYKINPPLFDVWARLLHAVPESVLWLVANNAAAETNLRDEARKRRLAGERLVFAKREPYARHLARLRLADLCLDTWPFNGGATTSDALWVGVPVVTRSGQALASRMSGSLLRTAGVPELITGSFAEYERVAQRLATDREAMTAVRSKLGPGGMLFDTDRICRELEAAYTMMWERFTRGEGPAALSVARPA